MSGALESALPAEVPTTYMGRVACRFCRHQFRHGRMAVTHLLDNHLDLVTGRVA